MAGPNSISVWLDEVKRGDGAAARCLWERYFPDLVRLARRKLNGLPRRMEDEEDVALSVFDSFCRAAEKGRFPDLDGRKSLWRLLCRITHFKAVDLIRRSQTGMGDARVLSGSFPAGSDTSMYQRVVPVAKPETQADFAAIVADEVRRLLKMLPSEELRSIAMAKMENYTNREIADKVGCAERTVERRLNYVRAIWKEEFPSAV